MPIEESTRTLQPEAVREAIDERTIGVVAILGSTYTAEFDDVKGIDAVIGASFPAFPSDAIIPSFPS